MLQESKFTVELTRDAFEARIRAAEEKLYQLEAGIRYERLMHRLRTSVYINLEQAKLTDRELEWVETQLPDADADTLLKLNKYLAERCDTPNPRQQYEQRAPLSREQWHGVGEVPGYERKR